MATSLCGGHVARSVDSRRARLDNAGIWSAAVNDSKSPEDGKVTHGEPTEDISQKGNTNDNEPV